MNKSEEQDRMIDKGIQELRDLGESKGAVLYSILFRKNGVGILWFEEKRAGARPKLIKGLDKVYSQLIQDWAGRGLHIYKYYSGISQALTGERTRLEEVKS